MKYLTFASAQLTRLVLPIACLSLAACGIDRGGAPIITLPPMATTADDAIVGPIESISSGALRINGQDIVTSNSTLTINGAAADLSMFRPGYYSVARVNKASGDNLASEVNVDLNLNAPIATYDAVADTLAALAQNVVLDTTTQIDVSLLGLNLSDSAQVPQIAVSGYTRADGTIVATHIGLGTVGAVSLTGFAAGVDTAQRVFTVGDQAIDYSASAVVDVAGGMPSDGERLRIAGPAPAAGQPFAAASVEAAPLLPALAEGATVTLAGFVTEFTTSADLAVAFVAASLSPTATFTNGTSADVAVDRLVLISGVLQADGRIVIDALEFLD